jgi:hypothetical protein
MTFSPIWGTTEYRLAPIGILLQDLTQALNDRTTALNSCSFCEQAFWPYGTYSLPLLNASDNITPLTQAINIHERLTFFLNISNGRWVYADQFWLHGGFVNHLDSAGAWHGKDWSRSVETTAFPLWTESVILTAIGETTREPSPAKLKTITPAWLLQTKKIINFLLWIRTTPAYSTGTFSPYKKGFYATGSSIPACEALIPPSQANWNHSTENICLNQSNPGGSSWSKRVMGVLMDYIPPNPYEPSIDAYSAFYQDDLNFVPNYAGDSKWTLSSSIAKKSSFFQEKIIADSAYFGWGDIAGYGGLNDAFWLVFAAILKFDDTTTGFELFP